jgi:glycosyltransferase involved in cell wall biosynthesis
MACGLPVVASPVGVNSDIVVDGETGFLARSPGDWEAALNRLLSDAVLRRQLGACGRERAVDQFSLAKHAPRLVSVFQKLARECA